MSGCCCSSELAAVGSDELEGEVDCFLCHQLPFLEDVKQLYFPKAIDSTLRVICISQLLMIDSLCPRPLQGKIK